MAAEAPTIPLLTPYKLGKFKLSHRYTKLPIHLAKFLLFLSSVFSMIWIVNMCDGFLFYFIFFGFFFLRITLWFFFFFGFDFVKKKCCFSRILNINLLKVWDFANFANVKIDGFCWNCISCLAELYSVHELFSDDFIYLISKENQAVIRFTWILYSISVV